VKSRGIRVPDVQPGPKVERGTEAIESEILVPSLKQGIHRRKGKRRVLGKGTLSRARKNSKEEGQDRKDEDQTQRVTTLREKSVTAKGLSNAKRLTFGGHPKESPAGGGNDPENQFFQLKNQQI